MAYTYAKLKGRIVEKYTTQGNFAKAVGVSEASLSKKLTCKTGFSQEDIVKWAQLLDIDNSKLGEYFFA